MARPGHPFENEERDQMRAEQRRLLRHLPAIVVGRSELTSST